MALLSEFPIAGPSGDGSGDMVAAVYDPTGQRRDIFAALLNKADKGLPQIYELPLSAGFENAPDDISRYEKNQFGEVTFQVRVKYVGSSPSAKVFQIGTLPVGFRPQYYVEIPVIVNFGSITVGIFAIDTLGGCYLHYYDELPSDAAVSCGGTFLAQ